MDRVYRDSREAQGCSLSGHFSQKSQRRLGITNFQQAVSLPGYRGGHSSDLGLEKPSLAHRVRVNVEGADYD